MRYVWGLVLLVGCCRCPQPEQPVTVTVPRTAAPRLTAEQLLQNTLERLRQEAADKASFEARVRLRTSELRLPTKPTHQRFGTEF